MFFSFKTNGTIELRFHGSSCRPISWNTPKAADPPAIHPANNDKNTLKTHRLPVLPPPRQQAMCPRCRTSAAARLRAGLSCAWPPGPSGTGALGLRAGSGLPPGLAGTGICNPTGHRPGTSCQSNFEASKRARQSAEIPDGNETNDGERFKTIALHLFPVMIGSGRV